ncbi:MAG: 2-isopropylmalate synthase [Alphaproteobacteria bacterium]|nr:MAG: 2-isopropylmalate synthase [Alphaproteobacteria bacterium]
MKHIIIFDTTLRDGEQSPGMSMTKEEKLLVAELLDTMGVDVIEAGFAMASEGDFQSVKAIAEVAKNAVICSLSRAKYADIERAGEAVKPAKRGRIHTFISTSDIHLKYQFRLEKPEVIAIIKDTVAYARRFTDDVEWSAMDATRSDLGFLCQAVEAAIAAGATTINLPDTVGYATPDDVAHMFRHVMGNVPNADKAVFSFHGQNDLGLATANTLAALQAGAGQAEVTINGIGERAGNTSLEEVVMTLKTRKDRYGMECGVKSEYIMRASRLIQSVTGQSVQVNKAIVGANAFAHESGIHQDGMLKHSGTYEIMTPESIGLTRSNLVMGKHSGRHAFKNKLEELNITLGDNAFEDAFNRFKALADKKKDVFDEDILSLVDGEDDSHALTLVSLAVQCGTGAVQQAEVVLHQDGQELRTTQQGNGPVDAIFKSIKTLVPSAESATLKIYQVHAVTAGTDAQAEVTVRLEMGETIINGHGADVDTLVASAKAYLDALNKVDRLRARKDNLLEPVS